MRNTWTPLRYAGAYGEEYYMPGRFDSEKAALLASNLSEEALFHLAARIDYEAASKIRSSEALLTIADVQREIDSPTPLPRRRPIFSSRQLASYAVSPQSLEPLADEEMVIALRSLSDPAKTISGMCFLFEEPINLCLDTWGIRHCTFTFRGLEADEVPMTGSAVRDCVIKVARK